MADDPDDNANDRQPASARNARREESGDGKAEDAGNESPEQKEARERKRANQKRVLRIVVPVAIIVVILLAFLWWLHARQFETTDDAQIDGHIYPISSQIVGHVTQVLADDGQLVKPGAMLVQIDPSDYRVTMDRMQADYENSLADARASALNVDLTRAQATMQVTSAASEVTNAQAAAAAAQHAVDQAKAQLAQAEANAKKQRDDVARYAQLLPKKEIAAQQYEQSVTAANVADAAAAQARAGVRAAEEGVVEARARVRQAEAQLENARVSPKQVATAQEHVHNTQAAIKRAKAGLESAQISLADTAIVAPVEGLIARRTVQPGQNVSPGQELLDLVPLHQIWVTANFKETQLRNMRPGQAVDVHVDAYNRDWHGRVASIGGATGSRTSLLPPENASGNYVKVVQRIPVRIELERDANREGLLRPGMSVIPRVRVR
jgi:membrane fusion protein (multidrug efflux system)